jgi:hypothetical protein
MDIRSFSTNSGGKFATNNEIETGNFRCWLLFDNGFVSTTAGVLSTDFEDDVASVFVGVEENLELRSFNNAETLSDDLAASSSFFFVLPFDDSSFEPDDCVLASLEGVVVAEVAAAPEVEVEVDFESLGFEEEEEEDDFESFGFEDEAEEELASFCFEED